MISSSAETPRDIADERLVNTLKEERERRDLTQAALAERVGVSRKTINTVENGVFVPSTILALKLAIALDRHVEELFWLDGHGVSPKHGT